MAKLGLFLIQQLLIVIVPIATKNGRFISFWFGDHSPLSDVFHFRCISSHHGSRWIIQILKCHLCWKMCQKLSWSHSPRWKTIYWSWVIESKYALSYYIKWNHAWFFFHFIYYVKVMMKYQLYEETIVHFIGKVKLNWCYGEIHWSLFCILYTEWLGRCSGKYILFTLKYPSFYSSAWWRQLGIMFLNTVIYTLFTWQRIGTRCKLSSCDFAT